MVNKTNKQQRERMTERERAYERKSFVKLAWKKRREYNNNLSVLFYLPYLVVSKAAVF